MAGPRRVGSPGDIPGGSRRRDGVGGVVGHFHQGIPDARGPDDRHGEQDAEQQGVKSGRHGPHGTGWGCDSRQRPPPFGATPEGQAGDARGVRRPPAGLHAGHRPQDALRAAAQAAGVHPRRHRVRGPRRRRGADRPARGRHRRARGAADRRGDVPLPPHRRHTKTRPKPSSSGAGARETARALVLKSAADCIAIERRNAALITEFDL
jgi:hypothetical protein